MKDKKDKQTIGNIIFGKAGEVFTNIRLFLRFKKAVKIIGKERKAVEDVRGKIAKLYGTVISKQGTANSEKKSPSSSPFTKGGEAGSLPLTKGELERDLIEIIPIPGASALTCLASVAGINMSKFSFLGFPPHKKGRETFFREVAESEYPVIYFESPHRFLKNLELLEKMKPDAKLIVGRELTKMFEEIRRGSVAEILEYYKNSSDKTKGEFVIIAY